MTNPLETLLSRKRELMDRQMECQREVICLIDAMTLEDKGRKSNLVREMNDITEELHRIENKLKNPCDMCEEKNFKEDGEGR